MPQTEITTSGQVAVSTDALKKALNALKVTTPTYSQKVHIAADDGDLYVETGTPAAHARVFLNTEGSADELDCVLSYTDLQTVVSATAAKEMALAVSGGTLDIAAGRRTMTLPLGDGAGFDSLVYEGGDHIATGGPAFVSAILRAITHASTDETVPILCGVLLEGPTGGDELGHVVGTDRYRLFCGEVTGVEPEAYVLLPGAITSAALKTIGKGDGVKLFDLGRQVMIDTGTTQWVGMKVDGQYASYRQLLPAEFSHQATIDREQLLASARDLSKLLRKNTPLRMRLDMAAAIILAASPPDAGTTAEAVPWEGSALDEETWAGMNPTFLAASLKALEGEWVTMEWNQPGKTFRFSDEFGNWTINMPISLQ
jgi:DNA polymerase III sliding clamp (beta) subunit (PCNA family)